MEQTLVIVLIVAVVAIATMYLVRRRQSASPQAPTETAKAQPVPPAPAPPAADTLAEPAAESAPVEQAAIDDENAILKLRAIELQGTASSKDDAIREAGGLLVATGAVDDSYIDSMFERERSVSTYMGNLLAIPHGTNEGMTKIRRSAISVVRYPNGLEWNGNPVKFVIGIAGADGQHLELLGRIAEVFLDESKVAQLEQAVTPEQVWRTLVKVNN
ncbi:PTS sugar transporter subunit IIA [Micropruina sp.]|uniref:PTS sugar transporter subunit IIA n=1 Tax=Micropruina sp. TaxID=2737536 RepID=UPI002628B9BE|nr:PTS sugar transporter subunit IIA [Micropruina sp.]